MRAAVAFALALAAALALAGLPRAAAQEDRIGASGGGARSMLTYLVFEDELAQVGLATTDHSRSQGLSGGAWGVLVAEAMKPADALKKYDEWTKSGKLIGNSFSGLAAGLKLIWTEAEKWKGYVESVWEPLGTAFAPNENGHAHVAIGAFETSWRRPTPLAIAPVLNPLKGGTTTDAHCQVDMQGATGFIVCNDGAPRHLQSRQWTGVQRMTWTFEMNRLYQATITSLAWLFGSTHPVFKAVVGDEHALPVRAPLEPKWNNFHAYELYDAGLTGNLPILAAKMPVAGVTVFCDSSFETVPHGSFDTTLRWFEGFHGIKMVASTRTSVQWRGRTLHLTGLGKFQRYVKVAEVHKNGVATGRVYVNIAFGRIRADGSVAPDAERMRLIETTVNVFDPKRFDHAAFETMNKDGRLFFRQLFLAMLRSRSVPLIKSAHKAHY